MRRAAVFLAALLACLTLSVRASASDTARHFYTADGTTADSYGGATALWNGTPEYAAGRSGQPGDDAFALDGTNYLTAGDSGTGAFGTSDFVLAFDVKVSTPGTYDLVSRRTVCGEETFLDVRSDGNGGTGVIAELQDAGNFGFNVAGPSIDDGAWHDIIVRRSGTTLFLTVDGTTASGNTSDVVNLDNTDPVEFGNGACVGVDGTKLLQGRLDNIGFAPGDSVVAAPTASARPSPSADNAPGAGRASTDPQVSAPVAAPVFPTLTRPTLPLLPGVSAAPSIRATPDRTRATAGERSSRPAATTARRSPRSEPSRSRGALPPVAGAPSAIAGQRVPGIGPARPASASRRSDAAVATARENVALSFSESLGSPGDSLTDARRIGEDLLLAGLLLALIGLPAALVNRTALENGPELSRLLVRARDALHLPAVSAASEGLPRAVALAIAAVVGGVLYGFLQPGLGLDENSVALTAGLAVSLFCISSVTQLVKLAYIGRAYADSGRIRLFPGFLLLGVSCVVVCRLIGLHPGLILGSLATVVLASRLERDQEGRAIAVSAGFVAASAAAAWFARASLVTAAGSDRSFLGQLVGVTLTGVTVAGSEWLVFELLPISFFEGSALWEWNRRLWCAAVGVGLFAFAHLLLSGVHNDEAEPFAHRVAWLGLLVGGYLVGALSFWGWFSFRPERFRPAHRPGGDAILAEEDEQPVTS